MAETFDTKVRENTRFGKNQWLGVTFVLLLIVLTIALFRVGASIYQNRKLYNEATNFTPTENSRIEIERWEEEQPGKDRSHTRISLTSVDAQNAVMEVFSKLEYGGFYLNSDSLLPIEPWKAVSVFDQKGHNYSILFYPAGERYCTSVVCIGSMQTYDSLSKFYPLKYDNWEPVRTYLDQFWEENTPIDGAVF